MNPALLLGAVALSLPAGWFAALLVERVPDNKSLFTPFPGVELSRRHPYIHLCTTGLFLATAIRFDGQPPLQIAAYLAFFTACVALSAIDLVTLRLPDRIVVPMIIVSIPVITVTSIVNDDPAQIRLALIGGAVYFFFLLLAHLVMPAGMGFGDVKLSALMGLYIGWITIDPLSAISTTLYGMIIGFVVGSAVGVVVFAFRRKSEHYPFGPFLMMGAITVIMVSAQLLPTT